MPLLPPPVSLSFPTYPISFANKRWGSDSDVAAVSSPHYGCPSDVGGTWVGDGGKKFESRKMLVRNLLVKKMDKIKLTADGICLLCRSVVVGA